MIATPFEFPNWTPEAVRRRAEELKSDAAQQKDAVRAEGVLRQLVSHPRMRTVWSEIYKRKREGHMSSEEYLHPARLTNASVAAAKRQLAHEFRQKGGGDNETEAEMLEVEASYLESEPDPPVDPRWSVQDRAAQLFLFHAYSDAIDIKPVFSSTLQDRVRKLNAAAIAIGNQSNFLKALGMRAEARKLKAVAADCADEAERIDPVPKTKDGDDPWIIVRNRGDAVVRTYIVDLSITTTSLFGKALYSTVATTTNVVFPQQNVTSTQVRDIWRSPSGIS